MTNKGNTSLPSDWVQRKLTSLQQELKASGKWPEEADQLVLDLNQNKELTESGVDETTFSIVVSDAIDGIDITKRHSKYYRQMLQDPELFQAFLDVMDTLEADRAGTLEPIPETEKSKTDVVRQDPPPVHEGLTDGRWAVLWRQTMAQLNLIFSGGVSNLAFNLRSAGGTLEESIVPLINSEAIVGEKCLGVRLSAVLADDSDTLNLRLTMAILDEDPGDFALQSLKAGVHWGAYQEIHQINELGQVVFEGLPIRTIADESGETIVSDLQLRIQSDS